MVTICTKSDQCNHSVYNIVLFLSWNSESLMHYENMSMQYIEFSEVVKNKNKKTNMLNNFYIILILAQNIECWYTLEPPRRGGSNKYPQSM